MDTTTMPKPPSGAQNESRILNEGGHAAGEGEALSVAGPLSRLQREVEAGFEDALRRTEIRLRSAYEHCKSEIREFPAQSVLIAAAGGYIIHRLPMRSILATGARMFGAFTPPTLVALGICKLAEYYTRRKAEESRRTTAPGISAPDAAPGLVVTDVL